MEEILCTAAKAGGNREDELLPVVPGDSCLLENNGGIMEHGIRKIGLMGTIVPPFHHSIIPAYPSTLGTLLEFLMVTLEDYGEFKSSGAPAAELSILRP